MFISGDDENETEDIYKELLDYYEDGLVVYKSRITY